MTKPEGQLFECVGSLRDFSKDCLEYRDEFETLGTIPEKLELLRDAGLMPQIAGDEWEWLLERIESGEQQRGLFNTLLFQKLFSMDLLSNEFTSAEVWISIPDTLNLRFGRFSNLKGRMDLRYSDFTGAVFSDCDLSQADLFAARFDGTDLSGAYGFVLNENSLRDTRFASRARDPYSILRNEYTGSRFGVVLMLTLFALMPHLARGFMPSYNQQKVWEAILHVNGGVFSIAAAVILIAYNVGRGYVTVGMGRLRDAEERSRSSPWKGEYYSGKLSLYSIHHNFLRYVYWLAIASALYKFGKWLSSDVPLWPTIPPWV